MGIDKEEISKTIAELEKSYDERFSVGAAPCGYGRGPGRQVSPGD